MAFFYGADSADFSSNVLPTLQQAWGVPPSFYCRYVGNYQITPDEVAYLRGLGVRIGLVYNLGGAGGGDGEGQARDAVARMQALGLHCLLFKDIETNMPTNTGFMLDWCKTLAELKVPGGFYANTEWAAFDDPYNQIVGQVDRLHRLIWASEPEPGYYPPSSPPSWNPYTPSGDPSAVVMWQFVEQAFGNIVDLNLCTQEAFDLLDGAKPPKPKPPVKKTYRVTVPGALKAVDPKTKKPSHRSPPAVDPHGQHVYLEVGAEVVPTGKKVKTDDNWDELTLVQPEGVVHGWYLHSNYKAV